MSAAGAGLPLREGSDGSTTAAAAASITTRLDFPPAMLRVKILSGAGLYKTDSFHEIDPYVEVSLGSDSSRSIALLRGGSDCAFNWTATFPFDPRRDYDGNKGDGGLVITVWDQDLGAKDDVVGRCVLPMRSVLAYGTRARAFVGKLRLVHMGRISGHKKDGGSLDVEIYWSDISVSAQRHITAAGTPPHLPLKYCVTNFNPLSGAARTLIDRGRLSEYAPFRTYRLRLWHVGLAFGGYVKGWNEGYDAAQKIYGRGPSSKLLRAALRAQNFMAYSNDYVNNMCDEHEIYSLLSLIEMLESYEFDADHRARRSSPRYTYVIMPDSHMHFSITSKKIATDFLSKHALHSGAAREVVYAGEFFFDRYSARAEGTGRTALVIDDNSGTFAPPKEKLDALRLLMQLNFGTELPILALDREDPLLGELSGANGVE